MMVSIISFGNGSFSIEHPASICEIAYVMIDLCTATFFAKRIEFISTTKGLSSAIWYIFSAECKSALCKSLLWQ